MTRKVQRRIRRFFNWKVGAGVLVALIALVAVGQILGIWAPLWRGLFGTAGPEGGYSCMPSCADNDSKMLAFFNNGTATFVGDDIVLWIAVPADWPSFEVGIFDGDSGRDGSGNLNMNGGHWDDNYTEATYALYADPAKTGATNWPVAQWAGQTMPDNQWFTQNLTTDQSALAPNKQYFIYRFQAHSTVADLGDNGFKVRTTGFMSAGRPGQRDASGLSVVGSEVGFIGMLDTWNDVDVVYPNLRTSANWTSTYSGGWQFFLYVPANAQTLEVWDGDFDRGTSTALDVDTNDPDTPDTTPSWSAAGAQPEGVGGTYLNQPGQGKPQDDYPSMLYRRTGSVWFQLVDPAGSPVYTDMDPSGTEEWEKFTMSTDPNAVADQHVAQILPGVYRLEVKSLDMHNICWFRGFCISSTPDGCKESWCDDDTCRCPRTIGYWKNNFAKILAGKTKGVQETRDSLTWGLRNVALASQVFRHADGTPLTLEEASAILNIKGNVGMEARARQQSLATWLNVATSKAGLNTYVTLNWGSGTFEGTIEQALLEIENILLNGGDYERAKSIADQINNALWGESAPDNLACSEYGAVIPPDRQAPGHKNAPKAPRAPEQPETPLACEGQRTNTYGVESPTNNPFYGIKFEYQSGTEVKGGAYDEFKLVLPTEVVSGLGAVQLEAKAGQDIGQVTLQGCQWSQFAPCETVVRDAGNFFEFAFAGGADNGDGTMTLTFRVTVFSGSGLSHVTIGLPDGVVPLSPTGSYQSQVCP